MYPRDLHLEDWPWHVISGQRIAMHDSMGALLPGLLRAEAFVRRSRFITANRIVVPCHSSKAPAVPPRIEHRLYSLFAE